VLFKIHFSLFAGKTFSPFGTRVSFCCVMAGQALYIPLELLEEKGTVPQPFWDPSFCFSFFFSDFVFSASHAPAK